MDLLFELGLSRQAGEKLTIKLDYETYWKKQDRQVKLINRYGYLVRAVSISLDQHLVQKLVAYLERRQTQPRDIYDIVWLKAQGAEIDWQYVKDNGLKKNIVDRVINKFEGEKSKLKTYQARLAPFLIDESHIDKLDLLPDLFRKI